MIPSHASLPLSEVTLALTARCGHEGFEVFNAKECERCRAKLQREAADLRSQGLHGFAKWIEPS